MSVVTHSKGEMRDVIIGTKVRAEVFIIIDFWN